MQRIGHGKQEGESFCALVGKKGAAFFQKAEKAAQPCVLLAETGRDFGLFDMQPQPRGKRGGSRFSAKKEQECISRRN